MSKSMILVKYNDVSSYDSCPHSYMYLTLNATRQVASPPIAANIFHLCISNMSATTRDTCARALQSSAISRGLEAGWVLLEAELSVFIIGNGNSVNEANQGLLIKEAIFPTSNRDAVVIWVSRTSRKIMRALDDERRREGLGPTLRGRGSNCSAPSWSGFGIGVESREVTWNGPRLPFPRTRSPCAARRALIPRRMEFSPLRRRSPAASSRGTGSLPRTGSRRIGDQQQSSVLNIHSLRAFVSFRALPHYERLREGRETERERERESENMWTVRGARGGWGIFSCKLAHASGRTCPRASAGLHPRSHPRCNETYTLYPMVHAGISRRDEIARGRCVSDKWETLKKIVARRDKGRAEWEGW